MVRKVLPSNHFKLVEYLCVGGKSPFADWFEALDPTTRARVSVTLNRMTFGNFGDCKAVGGGVTESRLHFGAGHRIYFARVGRTVLLLLGGGTKRRQASDISQAKARWSEYCART